jgi:hypothetical protein|tara:strand:- start:805 stop:1080 length:276 start_codon:yes stop_codon:yes gene_type:complete
MIYTYYKTVYKGFLVLSSILTVGVVTEAAPRQDDMLLELGIGIAAAILIIREVFAFLRVQAEDKKSQQQQEIRDLLWRIDQRLKKFHDDED